MKLSILIKRDASGRVTKIAAPFPNLSKSAILFAHNRGDIEEGRVSNEEIIRAIPAHMDEVLQLDQRLAVSVVPFDSSSYEVIEHEEGGSHEWVDIDITPIINSRWLKISSELLPKLVFIVFILSLASSFFLDVLFTERTANINQNQAITSAIYDVMSSTVAYILSDTTMNMALLSRRIMGWWDRCFNRNNGDYAPISEDMVIPSNRDVLMSYLKSPRTYLALVVAPIAAYNFYVNSLSDYNVTMSNIQDAQAENLTSIPAPVLTTWTNVDFAFGLMIDGLTMVGQFLVAAAIVAKNSNLLPSPLPYLRSCLEPLTRRLGFFSHANENAPLLTHADINSGPPSYRC